MSEESSWHSRHVLFQLEGNKTLGLSASQGFLGQDIKVILKTNSHYTERMRYFKRLPGLHQIALFPTFLMPFIMLNKSTVQLHLAGQLRYIKCPFSSNE